MPRRRTPWTHPAYDADVNFQAAEAQKNTDPRCHSGPCAETHEMPLTPRTTAAPPQQHWDSNQAARWLDCGKCNLRLMYYPKKGYTGNHRKTVSPQVVQLALNETYRNPGWEYMDHNLMRLTIIRIEVEMRIAGTFQNKTVPKAKPRQSQHRHHSEECHQRPGHNQPDQRAKSQSSDTLPRFGNIHPPSVHPPDSETSFEKVDRISIDSDSEDKHIDIKGTRSEEMKHERKKMNSDMAQIRKEKDKIVEAATSLATTTGRSNSSQPSSADHGSSLAWT